MVVDFFPLICNGANKRTRSTEARRYSRNMPAPSPTPAPPTIDLTQEPGHLIRRAHQRAVSVFHDTHGREVTPVQYALLRALEREPGIDQVTLADRVALDTSTTADIAARMEKKGWIRRELLARRQRSLHLTEQGRLLLATMLPRVGPMYDQLLGALDATERQQLLDLLQKLVGLPPHTTAG